MGFFKLMYYLISVTSVTFIVLNYLPNLLEIEPQAYSPKLLRYEGALAVNKELDKGKIILKDEVIGPESLEIKNGEIYTSLRNAKIVLIKDDKIRRTVADLSGGSKIPSTPLGLRFYKEDLYVADAHRGIMKVDIKTGTVVPVLSKSEVIRGKKINAPNDLDIENGVIYFSDLTTKWKASTAFYGMLEHDNSGRVYRHDIATKQTEVLLDGLYFPNGIQLTHDKQSLLIAECLKSRILRYHLSGAKKGETEVFSELPGEPDNIRTSSSGGYWVPMLSSRESSSPHPLDYLATYPKIRKALARLSHVLAVGLDRVNQYVSSPVISSITDELKSGIHFLMLINTNHPVLIEIDSDGKIARSLHSSNSKFAYLSQTIEHNGHLYLGSYINSYIVKLKI